MDLSNHLNEIEKGLTEADLALENIKYQLMALEFISVDDIKRLEKGLKKAREWVNQIGNDI